MEPAGRQTATAEKEADCPARQHSLSGRGRWRRWGRGWPQVLERRDRLPSQKENWSGWGKGKEREEGWHRGLIGSVSCSLPPGGNTTAHSPLGPPHLKTPHQAMGTSKALSAKYTPPHAPRPTLPSPLVSGSQPLSAAPTRETKNVCLSATFWKTKGSWLLTYSITRIIVNKILSK